MTAERRAVLGALASALGLIEGVSDGLAGIARLGGALADDRERRRTIAVGGYTATTVLSSLVGAATAAWRVGILGAGAWTARGLCVPAPNVLLADVVDPSVDGRASGFERTMDGGGEPHASCTRPLGRVADRCIGPYRDNTARRRMRHVLLTLGALSLDHAGSSTSMVVPLPPSTMPTVPLWARTSWSTTASPMPVPAVVWALVAR